jgi:hypothetical protein
MHVGEMLSELKKQRRRIDRAIAVLEMLKPQPTRKQKTYRRKSKSRTETSRNAYPLSTEKEISATAEPSRARVIPFGRLRRQA